MLYACWSVWKPWIRVFSDYWDRHTVRCKFSVAPHFRSRFYISDKELLVGLDGTYQLWKNSSISITSDGITDDNRFNNLSVLMPGMEYVIDPYSQNFFSTYSLQRRALIFQLCNVSVYNPVDNKSAGMGSFNGLNVGLGLPFHDLRTGHVSMLNIGFGYTRQQTGQWFYDWAGYV